MPCVPKSRDVLPLDIVFRSSHSEYPLFDEDFSYPDVMHTVRSRFTKRRHLIRDSSCLGSMKSLLSETIQERITLLQQ